MEDNNENCTHEFPNVSQYIVALGYNVFMLLLIPGGISLFFLMVLYLHNVVVNIMRNPPWTRRCQAWITSLPMAVSFLSLSSFVVPRAAVMCETIKFTYMAFIFMQIIEVTLVIGGGEKKLLKELGNAHFYPLELPFYGSLQCLRFAVTKKNLRIAIALVYQTFICTSILSILMGILEYAEVLRRHQADLVLWIISIPNFVSCILGSWSLVVLVTTLNSHIESKWPKFKWKCNALIYFVALQKFQNFLVGILTICNITSTVYGKTIDAGLSMLEAFIWGLFFFYLFRVGVVYTKEKNTHTDNLAADEPFNTSATANNELATDNSNHIIQMNSLPNGKNVENCCCKCHKKNT